MNHSKLNLKITGVSPLIMRNGQLADPLNNFNRALSKITKKKSKTEADHEEMARIEFHGGLYVQNNTVIVPAEMLEGSIINGAKKFKRGQVFKAGFFIEDHAILQFGKKIKADKLWDHRAKYSIRSGVRVQTSKLFRVRPKFNSWSLSFTVYYDTTLLDEEEIYEAVRKAGAQVGIGDWRPKYGRFLLDN